MFASVVGTLAHRDGSVQIGGCGSQQAGVAHRGVHQGLAPVLDVIRDPRWGRIEECISEDPYLVANAAELNAMHNDLGAHYRLTADNRILFGGYDAIYHPGRKVRPGYEERPDTYRRLAEHFFATFPQLEGLHFSHRWAGAIDTCTRFCAFYGVARSGRVAYSAGFTGLGVAATRFAADVMLDLLDGEPTERTSLRMVRERPLPFPPEPVAALGIAATKWSLDQADHDHGRRNLFLRTLDAVGLGFDS